MNPRLCIKKLHVLYEFSRLIGRALHLEETLSDILKVLSESLSMQRATLILQNERTGDLEIRASHGLSEEERQRGVYQEGEGEGVTGRVFQTAEPYVIPDIRREPLFLNKTGSREIEKSRLSFLGVPILLQGEAIGVLNVDRLFGNEISLEEDVEFLTIVAALISQLVSLNHQVEAREKTLLRANRSLRAEISERYHNFFMVGASPAMREVQHLVGKVAQSRASVLLLGESGTGKTLVARILHEMSSRAQNPFVKLNCAALPENLLESELFGYERGAFTGADKAKAGRIEMAEGGTLFLDEIGELPLLLQTKLLRFLQEREFERLGSNETREVDVRVVTATNRALEAAVEEGAFREDLYYRLNVFPIVVPALRDRSEDIPLLLKHFLERFGREYNKKISLTPRAQGVLEAYPWPGNVREMENLVERLAILTDKPTISYAHLPPHIVAPASGGSNGRRLPGQSHLKDIERREVIAALERNQWIQSRAARELGITVRQLGYRVKKFNLHKGVSSRKDSAH